MSEQILMEAMEHLSKLVACLAQAGSSNPDAVVSVQPAAFPIAEAAKYIGVSRSQIYVLEEAGELKRMKGESPPRFSRKELDRYIQKRE